MDMVEAPGCPEGSLKVVAYIQERQPAELAVRTPDEDCIKVLRLVLPLFNYVIVDVYKEGDLHVVKARRAKT
ncbi:conserved hypothetical protein [Pyrobaculum islandicum DSM 4184]|uniref:Uncharacterized protein n=1 Tax=Pyrobaculum islandicum (strain DSM 4184 / JCM 9189 / GEO3) TaxID=384616 RepID=A1RUB4_PYRIL|nr:hypothetical protein [Pyrobaculum islandicum]ABL88546.1 conserved hypothetical protein [Pyrobaculum islandicum DSM 4184]